MCAVRTPAQCKTLLLSPESDRRSKFFDFHRFVSTEREKKDPSDHKQKHVHRRFKKLFHTDCNENNGSSSDYADIVVAHHGETTQTSVEEFSSFYSLKSSKPMR